MTTTDRLLSLKDTAAMLSVSQATVRRKVDTGELPKPIQMGRLTRFRLSEIDAALERMRKL